MNTVAPNVRLAHVHNINAADDLLRGKKGTLEKRPSILVSYAYLKGFEKKRNEYQIRDWVLDSGAFTAHYSGSEIVLEEYVETCKRLLAQDQQLKEVFALDVIGDWKQSIKNTEKMWEAGIHAIPVFHQGSPEDALLEIAKTYPKIALGGVARMQGSIKMRWASWCFGKVWPAKIHGFGFGTRSQLLELPWHSVDATNWQLGPTAFGNWTSFGRMSVRGTQQNLTCELNHFLESEELARIKWKDEMQTLENGTTI